MDFFELFGNISKEHNDREETFRKLQAETPKLLHIGDKVLIASGLLGRGFLWIREEAIIKDMRDTAIKVELPSVFNETKEYWIDKILVTDIVERANYEFKSITS